LALAFAGGTYYYEKKTGKISQFFSSLK